jgi:hypothetical protein
VFTFRKIQTRDSDLQRLQDNVADAFRKVGLCALVDGALLQNIVLVGGSTAVAHGLQRQPLGWIIVDRSASVTVYRTAWDALNLTLQSSGAATVSIWVF